MNLIAISEAEAQSHYSHVHIKYLVRTGKIEGRKSGGVWLVDVDSLKAYENRMKELGPQKFDSAKPNLTA